MKKLALLLLTALITAPLQARTADGHRRIVLIAGSKTHGPGEHEYLKTIRLFKVLLDRAPSLKGAETLTVYDGWPTDESILDTADTIVYISDGMQWLPWTWTPEHIAAIQKQMDRGCGFMTLHFADYVPYKFSKYALEWNGGYVDYNGPTRPPEMFFTQKTITSTPVLATPSHPVLNGVKPFEIKEEYYYKATFMPHGITPILRIPELPDDPKTSGPPAKPEEQVTVWAYDRPRVGKNKEAGRSVGATLGHSYSNYQIDSYRKLLLNAIVWTAHLPVPKDGIASKWIDLPEVDKVLGPTPEPVKSPLEPAK
jgi:type 1 glutamine amidotransferase